MRILFPATLAAAVLALQTLPAPSPAAAASPDTSRYALDPAKSTLQFTFTQAGAQNKGRFKRFTTALDWSGNNPAASRLEVTVDMTSVDTGDQERDDTLRDVDLFGVRKFAQARFESTQIVKTASGYEAVGKLTIRDISRELHVPFSFRTATEQGVNVGYMSGKTSLRRLDYGVGQGDWKATDQVGNDVGVAFELRLIAH
jgi:polyisoprenoid-binding protein YceI